MQAVNHKSALLTFGIFAVLMKYNNSFLKYLNHDFDIKMKLQHTHSAGHNTPIIILIQCPLNLFGFHFHLIV